MAVAVRHVPYCYRVPRVAREIDGSVFNYRLGAAQCFELVGSSRPDSSCLGRDREESGVS